LPAAIGIDLGTSNTCSAVVRPGGVVVIPDDQGRRVLPSFLTLDEQNEYVVGYPARSQAISNPYETIYAIKRLMGQRYGSLEVQTARRYLTYPVLEGPTDDIRVQVKDRVLAPEEVSAEILRIVKSQAERFLGEPVNHAVITVPAHFNDGQRKATKRAGELAGLDVLRLINEPTSAALAYGFGKQLSQRIAVYDFGGGTFDITILSIGDQVYEVLSTNGDSYLGGEDFSNRLTDHVCEEFRKSTGIDLRPDRTSLQRVKDAAEWAKIGLSTDMTTKIRIPQVVPWHDPNIEMDMTIEREVLEAMVKDLVQRSLEICQVALDLSRLTVDDIDSVILVGGQTRMPLVQRKVQEFFRKAPNASVNPDEVVAVGAAIQANALMSSDSEMLLLDVTPLTLGIASFGDMFSVLIDKNSKVPRKVSRIFTTNSDYQERVRIVVCQGESKKASDNVFLGEFTLEGIRRAPRMEPRIEVTFKLDANGILQVSGRDLDTGQEQTITIRDYARRATEYHPRTPPPPDPEGAVTPA
jgi:molecular chaperone DnaK